MKYVPSEEEVAEVMCEYEKAMANKDKEALKRLKSTIENWKEDKTPGYKVKSLGRWPR